MNTLVFIVLIYVPHYFWWGGFNTAYEGTLSCHEYCDKGLWFYCIMQKVTLVEQPMGTAFLQLDDPPLNRSQFLCYIYIALGLFNAMMLHVANENVAYKNSHW